jgi:hypothetical protein
MGRGPNGILQGSIPGELVRASLAVIAILGVVDAVGAIDCEDEMNAIARRQAEEDQLRLLRARSNLYSQASTLASLQIILTVLLPVAGAILSIWRPELRAPVAATSLAILALDALVFDRQQRLILRRAAKIMEQFDCVVLEMPWASFVTGEKAEVEEINNAAARYSKRHDDSMVLKWYPEYVAQTPTHIGRIICQRSNLRYGSQLRRGYSSVIAYGVVGLLALLIVAGFAQNLRMNDWILTVAPATPVLAWAAREFYRHHDMAEALEELLNRANRLWEAAGNGEFDVEACQQKSRELQNAIYWRRAAGPVVLSFLYRWKRTGLEDEMRQTVADMTKESASVPPPIHQSFEKHH